MECFREQCEGCKGLRGHKRIKDEMSNSFELEYKKACEELEQLKRLVKEVFWYYFETQCRNWRPPWFESLAVSQITLHGCICEFLAGGRVACTFPIWYSGAVADAPPLPPSIVMKELEQARVYMDFMQEQRFAPYDWAPGGHKYQQLLRQSAGVHAYNRMHARKQSSKSIIE